MNAFLLDLWHDLRAKRLWLVAVALAVGLVAVPLLLIDHPEATPTATTPPPAAAKNADTPTIELADDAALGSSDLEVFDPKNPFKPRVRLRASTADAPATASAGGAGSSSGEATSPSSVGDTGAGDVGGTGGGAPTPPPASPPRVKVVNYTYVVDVTFTHNDHEPHHRSLRQLDTLPRSEAALLIFLGVGVKGHNAVFLVDSKLVGAGEGRCKPSRTNCAVLYLGRGEEHEFVDENGDSYTLRLDRIRKVRLDADSDAGSSRVGSAQRAHTALGAPRRFVPPVLNDLTSVGTPVARGSGGDEDRR
jgi:hypothetical protein